LAGKVPANDDLIGGRQLFLVLISFVVCMVGIANAMLMAITERFREIATMKCLGATDGFILTQFLMEAAMQGAAGGVLGMVIGFFLSLAADGAVYGGHLFAYFPITGVLACSGVCIFAGLLLATLASIYPSWMASRMAPMDAMRVE
jgi:putative ABC transport system permease protein